MGLGDLAATRLPTACDLAVAVELVAASGCRAPAARRRSGSTTRATTALVDLERRRSPASTRAAEHRRDARREVGAGGVAGDRRVAGAQRRRRAAGWWWSCRSWPRPARPAGPGRELGQRVGRERVDHASADRRARAASGDARQPSGGLAGRDRGRVRTETELTARHRALAPERVDGVAEVERVEVARLGVRCRGSRGPRRACGVRDSAEARRDVARGRDALDDAVTRERLAVGELRVVSRAEYPPCASMASTTQSRDQWPRFQLSVAPASATTWWMRSIHGVASSHAFQTRPSRPPGRSTRWNSLSAAVGVEPVERLGDGDRVERRRRRTAALPPRPRRRARRAAAVEHARASRRPARPRRASRRSARAAG